MNIGIIVYSQTGHTLSVAERIRDELLKSGHKVSIEKVIPVSGEPMDIKNIKLESAPDVSGYEALLFGAPVQAFSLAPVMNAYLSQLPDLSGRSFSCFTTQQFPFPWMGGNHTISQMQKICTSKGGKFTKSGIVNWSSKKRENMIDEAVKELSNL